MNRCTIPFMGLDTVDAFRQIGIAGLRGEVEALKELTAELTRELRESWREVEEVRGELEGSAMREAECRRMLEERIEEQREAAAEYAMLCREEVRALCAKQP